MEQERRRLMYLVFAFAALLMIGIFLTDWIFSTTDLMTEGILGMIVGSALTWPAAYVAYDTTDNPANAKTRCMSRRRSCSIIFLCHLHIFS